MQEDFIEIVVEVSMFLLYGVATTALAGVGSILEYRGYLFINSGQTGIALYAAALGVILLTLAYAWTEVRTELF